MHKGQAYMGQNGVLLVSSLFSSLRASAMLKHVIDIVWTSVCLSVRPSCFSNADKPMHIVSMSVHGGNAVNIRANVCR